jgi:hypothetical protein
MSQYHVEIMRFMDEGFEVLSNCWFKERTLAWFNHYHHLTQGYERLPETKYELIRLVIQKFTL